MTSPHNFTLDRKTEKIFEEFKDLARKERKTVSSLLREFIIEYVESRNAKVSQTKVFNPARIIPDLSKGLLMISQKPRDPYPQDKEGQDAWIKKYPRKTTVTYAK